MRQISEPRRSRPTRPTLAAAAVAFAAATVLSTTSAWADAGPPCGPGAPSCAEAAAGGSGTALGSAVHERDLAAAQEATASPGSGTARTVLLGGALIVIGAGAVLGSLQSRARAPVTR